MQTEPISKITNEKKDKALVTSIYTIFAFRIFFMCPHINSVNLGMPVVEICIGTLS